MQPYIVVNGDITHKSKTGKPVVVDAVMVSCNTGPDVAASIAIDALRPKHNDRLHVYRIDADSLVAAGVVVFQHQTVDYAPALKTIRSMLGVKNET